MRILDEIERLLGIEPTVETRRRKRLVGLAAPWQNVRPIWQLRIGEYRIFYDVDESTRLVSVRAIRRKGRKTTEETL